MRKLKYFITGQMKNCDEIYRTTYFFRKVTGGNMKPENQLAHEMSTTEPTSKHICDVPTASQNSSPNPIPFGQPVKMTRKELNRILAKRADRGGSEECRGSKPLDYEPHEALAQYLAAPEGMGEFKSITSIAKHFKFTRVTVHR